MSTSQPEARAGYVYVQVGKELFSFENFDDWCDTAKRKFKKAKVSSHQVICVDASNRICVSGFEFMRARDEQAYPVRAYEVAV